MQGLGVQVLLGVIHSFRNQKRQPFLIHRELGQQVLDEKKTADTLAGFALLRPPAMLFLRGGH